MPRTQSVVKVCALICCAAILSANIAHSQSSGQKFLLVGNQGALYMVDTLAGTAMPLAEVDPAAFVSFSPDQAYLAVFGDAGLTVYRVAGNSLQRLADVTKQPTLRAVWSQDSKSVTYLRGIKSPGGGVTDEISIWNRETGQTKRLL